VGCGPWGGVSEKGEKRKRPGRVGVTAPEKTGQEPPVGSKMSYFAEKRGSRHGRRHWSS